MTRIVRTLLAAAALAALTFNTAHAQAGPLNVQFSDPNCASWALTGSAPNFTLTCQALSCSIIATPPTPLPTDNVALTATCAGATTYAWNLLAGPGGCPAISSATATANLTAPGGTGVNGCVYRVAASDPTNGSGQATVLLNWTTTPPQSPTGCSVNFTVGGATMSSAGGAVTMVASCSQNTNGSTVWTWTKGGAAFGAGGTTMSDTLPANTGTSAVNTTYAVTATNAGALPTTTQQVVSVQGTGGGGGSFDLTGCSAAGYIGRGLDITFPTTVNSSIPNGAQNANPGGTFGNADALVVRFTTPALGVNPSSVFQPAGNVPYQNTSRLFTLATVPCQFATSSTPTGSIVYATVSQSPAITINVGACPYSAFICPLYGAWLQPSTTYYMTMTNKTGFGGGGSCASSSCDMRIDFNK